MRLSGLLFLREHLQVYNTSKSAHTYWAAGECIGNPEKYPRSSTIFVTLNRFDICSLSMNYQIYKDDRHDFNVCPLASDGTNLSSLIIEETRRHIEQDLPIAA